MIGKEWFFDANFIAAKKFDIATYLPGEENAEYMAAATLTALAVGINQDAIVDGIANYEPNVSPIAENLNQ